MQGFQRPVYQQKQQPTQQQGQAQQGLQQQGQAQQGFQQPIQNYQQQGYPQQQISPMGQSMQPTQSHQHQQQPMSSQFQQQFQGQSTQPLQPSQYQINAATYSAYPEHDPEFVQKGISYQHGSVQKGWNDPPVVSKLASTFDVMPKSEMVGKLTQTIATIKQRSPPQKQRMIDDTERRMDSFFDQLETFDNSECLGGLTAILKSLDTRDFGAAKQLITDLMVKFQDQSKWLLGVKRMVDLLESC